MNPEIKAQWVSALRSGEYKQTDGTLHRVISVSADGEGYCCLGVLCDIAVKAGVIRSRIDGSREVFEAGTEWESGVLPAKVERWAGLDNENPMVRTAEGYDSSLASLNDDGYSFGAIADLIENQL